MTEISSSIIPTHKKPLDLEKERVTKFVKDHRLGITANNNNKVINFLDNAFDLSMAIFKSYTKELYNHRYISKKSKHHLEF